MNLSVFFQGQETGERWQLQGSGRGIAKGSPRVRVFFHDSSEKGLEEGAEGFPETNLGHDEEDKGRQPEDVFGEPSWIQTGPEKLRQVAQWVQGDRVVVESGR